MNKGRTLIVALLAGAMTAVIAPSCSNTLHPTTVEVEDSVRTYYPVIQGQELDLQFRIANTGRSPLVITDIQPSCGCISVNEEDNNIIPPGKYITLKFRYYSEKNIGHARHIIRLYGNIVPNGQANCVFDVNVVPLGDYTRDYEELHSEMLDKRRAIDELVDGDASEKGYYVDPAHDSRVHSKFPWRRDEQ